MKPEIVAAIEKIAGDCLTPDQRGQIADEAIKIMELRQKQLALAAVEGVKQELIASGTKGDTH